MVVNLKSLFEMQKALDSKVEKKHPILEGEDRLTNKILALQVELGELANELPRTFKFWSNKKNDYKKALVEYVDCLHFILSIGLEIGHGKFKFNPHYKIREEETANQFLNVMKYTTGLMEDDYYSELLHSFVYLGESLGFTWEQIEHAYISKNEVNHDRQNTGY